MRSLFRLFLLLTLTVWGTCFFLQLFGDDDGSAVRISAELAGALAFVIASPLLLVLHGVDLWTDWSSVSMAEQIAVAIAVLPLWAALACFEGRLRRHAGIFNPFGYQCRCRPFLLKILVGTADWWNKIRYFGKRKTGGWASLFEVLATPYRSGYLFLGRPRLFTNAGFLCPPVGIPTDKHFLLLAEPGAQKTTGFAVPSLCLHEGSALVLDVVGELAWLTAARRGNGGNGVRGLGQSVHVIDPFGIAKGLPRASFNIFAEMAAVCRDEPSRAIAYAYKIAEALIRPSSGAENEYFDNAARSFVAALVLWIFIGPPETRTLRTLRRLLMEGDVVAHSAARAMGGNSEKSKLSAFDRLLLNMEFTPPGPYRDVIAGGAATLLQMGERQRGSVVSTATEATTFLDFPEILGCTDKSDFSLADFKTKKQTVYLCLPLAEVKGKCGGFARLFIICFIDQMMTKLAEDKAIPTLLLIDEMPSLGRIERIEVVGPVMRKYGVRLAVIGQDISMFQTTYPKDWESFVGTAEAVQFMAVKHPTTVAYLKKLLGEKIITERGPDGLLVSRPVPLLDEEQIPRFLADGNQIVWRGKKRTMRLKTAPYYWYLPYWMYAPDPRFKEPFFKAWLRRRAAG
jgi:type IV secretory system conjugative DNA transfer VirD4/TraG family protein